MTPRAISQATVGNVRTTPRPPLTKRLRPSHWKAVDYVVGGLLGLFIFAAIRASIRSAPYQVRSTDAGTMVFQVRTVSSGTSALITFAVAGVVVIAIARRRKHPMASLCLLLGSSILVAILSGGEAPSLTLFVPTAYVLYLIVATFENRRRVGLAIAVIFAVIVVDAAIMTPRNGVPIARGNGFIPVIFCVVVAWSFGYIVRQRRRYSIGLQEEAASKAVAVERLRIARELHDVVAHSMSVIAVQAGYGQYVIDSQPADARQALGAIQATSREALEEMRRMLGALRYADEAGSVPAGPVPTGPAGSAAFQPATETGLAGLLRSLALPEPAFPAAGPASPSAAAPLFPAPGLADLDRLITRTAGVGVLAEVRRVGTLRDLPPSIDLSAYRIVQEALTNVVKHANASACSVLLDYGDDALTIEVTDSGAGVPALAFAMAGGAMAGGAMAGGARPAVSIPAGGHGIIGMRERVSLLGGEFTAGPLPGYGFRVSARIPLPFPLAPNGVR
jgi:signal transduction histidine kinase